MAELVKIAQARGENRANAIFFHGLGGDARTTWQPTYIKKGEASLWLEWLAQDIKPRLGIDSIIPHRLKYKKFSR